MTKACVRTQMRPRVTVRAIARDTRLAPSSLCEHFADQEEILRALGREILDRLGAKIGLACDLSATGSPHFRDNDRRLDSGGTSMILLGRSHVTVQGVG